jgi:hypothetical protein
MREGYKDWDKLTNAMYGLRFPKGMETALRRSKLEKMHTLSIYDTTTNLQVHTNHFLILQSMCTGQSPFSRPPKLRKPRPLEACLSHQSLNTYTSRTLILKFLRQLLHCWRIQIIHHATLLDNRHPLRRLKRHDRRLRSPRPQATHRRSGAHCELGNRCSVSGKYSLIAKFNPNVSTSSFIPPS